MKLIHFHRKPISMFVMFTFIILLCFWANQAPAASTAPAAKKNSGTTLEQGDGSSPDFFEQEREDAATVKKPRKFPWLLVGLGVGAIVAALVLLSSKKSDPPPLSPTTGSIHVNSSPSAAKVYLDGNDTGRITPAILTQVASGSHTLRLILSDYFDYAETCTVSANQTSTVSAILVPAIKMVYINGGTFKMGSNSDVQARPIHKVTLTSFYIGKYEVTQGQWRTVMGANPSNFQKGDNYPVEKVSWDDCQEFISKLNQQTGKHYRLPTEAEWEYAARGRTTGDCYGDIDNIAWHEQNSGNTTHPVGQKQPNAYGLYDMLGNVFEWVQDWLGFYSSADQTNPTGPATGTFRCRRGGSWDWYSLICGAPFRGWLSSYMHSNDGGFRLAAVSL